MTALQCVHLEPGEARELAFALGPRALSLWNRERGAHVEPGEFRVMLGASSRDIRLQGLLTVAE